MRHGCLDQVEHREDIDLEGLQQLIRRDILDALLRILDSGVVHQHIQLAELVEGLLHGIPAELLVGDIAGDQQAAALVLLHQRFGLFGISVLIEIQDRHVRAFLGKGDRHGATDPAVATGDQGHLALQLAAAALGIVLCPGTRLELILHARLLLLVLGRALYFLFLCFLRHMKFSHKKMSPQIQKRSNLNSAGAILL